MSHTCTKRIHDIDCYGVAASWTCGKPTSNPEHLFCSKHYKRWKEKQLNWIDRDTYRACTEEDMLGKILKLKHTNSNDLYRRKADNLIWQYNEKSGKYDIPTKLPVDHNLFCIKK